MTDNHDPEPDIVEIILRACQAGGLDADAAQQIEHTIRATYGGLRVRIPKRKKHLTPEQRQQVYQAGLSNAPNEEITNKYRIDRATLYRLMKRGE
jgi:DNA invertase Pin-like site-specific DNA recombinase